ncbi:MAG: class I SAM-dependent methyltransferase [Burkholderiales bacterium]
MADQCLPLRRPERAEPFLNALEREWWDANASTIARVWQMPDEVSRFVRQGYLQRARQFLTEGRSRTTVIELGCGSGWVGQSIAGPDLHIVGIDFSSAQIGLASTRATETGVAAFCSYSLSGNETLSKEPPTADAALLHAYLHHLDEAEIASTLQALRATLAPGARIWIYEPAFRADRVTTQRIRLSTRIAMRAALVGSRMVRLAGAACRVRNSTVAAKFEELAALARKSGWYLSPKEVPLEDAAFTHQLARHFRVRSSYWATLHLVGWAYECALLERSVCRRIACGTYLPLARIAERLALLDAAAVEFATTPPRHAFKVWECEVGA